MLYSILLRLLHAHTSFRLKLCSFLKLKVGKSVRFSPLHFRVKGNVEIGNYCAIGNDVKIISGNHNYGLPALQTQVYKEKLHVKYPSTPLKCVIGNDVWIGDGAIILPGVEIGNGAVIGAGSVVTKNIPPFGIAVGNPAKVFKYRFSEEIIDFLQKIQWWNWSDQKIKRNKNFFLQDLSNISLDELKELTNK